MRSALVLVLTWLFFMFVFGSMLSALVSAVRGILHMRQLERRLNRRDRRYIERGTDGTEGWRRRFVNRRRQREGRPPLE